MTPYVSIDIETTGLDFHRCDVLEIGMVVDDWVTPVRDLPTFHCYVKHTELHGQPYAFSMHPEILRRIAIEEPGYQYLSEAEVGPAVAKWLDANGIDSKNVTGAGKNFATFDLRFLERLVSFRHWVKFHHRVIDPAMLYWQPEIDETLPNMETCLKRAGITKRVGHKAVEDARDVVWLIRSAYDKTPVATAEPAPKPKGLFRLASMVRETMERGRAEYHLAS